MTAEMHIPVTRKRLVSLVYGQWGPSTSGPESRPEELSRRCWMAQEKGESDRPAPVNPLHAPPPSPNLPLLLAHPHRMLGNRPRLQAAGGGDKPKRVCIEAESDRHGAGKILSGDHQSPRVDMPKTIVLRSLEEQAQGLIGMKPIPADTFFVFPNVRPGTIFHSRGVLESFDIAFIDAWGRTIFTKTIMPPHEVVTVPQGAVTAVEARAGGIVSPRFSGLFSRRF